jgi:hypothetical protein
MGGKSRPALSTGIVGKGDPMRFSALLLLAAACGHTADRGTQPPITATTTADAAPAPADGMYDDCTLDRAAVAGALRHNDKGTKTILAPTYNDEERHVTEAIELADGTRITFHVGGCAHYAWEMTYEVPASAVGADPERRLDAAEALLRRTPMGDSLAVDMADRIKARSRKTVRPAQGPWSIDCGDANCAVNATVDGATLEIVVGYDFAL